MSASGKKREVFAEDPRPIRREPVQLDFFLDLDGYEGPIDLLLGLARDQKLDLVKISIVALADQYLDYIAKMREFQLEVAADYLVMAAWLAYLKSRLLLPEQPDEEEIENPEELAARLAFQLQRLEAMQQASKKLFVRPQKGIDYFERGRSDPVQVVRDNQFDLSLYELLKAYGGIRDKMTASHLRIMPTDLYSMDDAIERLRQFLGVQYMPDWMTLESFLPKEQKNTLISKSALAATFAASLELAREGVLEIRQSGIFEPIFFRSAERNIATIQDQIDEEQS